MNHLYKVLIAASIGLTGAYTASAEDQVLTDLNFHDPKYNIVDDLSDYGGDQRWPAPTVTAEPVSADISGTGTPKTTPKDTIPNSVTFDDPRYNVVDELSAYGGDHRWPASEAAPAPGSKDIASASELGKE